MNHLLIRTFRKHLRSLEREIGMLLAEETECCSVTVAQCHLLLEMEARGPSSLQDLADALVLDKSTLSRTVDALVRDGFTERTEDPTNRRKVSLSLTLAGREKCEYIHSLCDSEYRSLFSHISTEKHAMIIESIDILASAMEQERRTKTGTDNVGGDPCCAR